jgi:hypothetical protein
MYTKSKSKELKAKSRIEKLFIYAFLLVFSLSSLSANAQCAMCRAALTSEGNTTKAAAVNDGIVYLMVIPYLLVAGIGYAIYRMKKKKS